MSRHYTANLLAQLLLGSAVLAGCSLVGGIKDNFHTVGDASASGGDGGTGGTGTGGSAAAGGTGAAGAGAVDGGGAGGSGGKPATRLGDKCQSDADCGGLTCLRPDSSGLTNGGPSRGYCTTSCNSSAECGAISARRPVHEPPIQ